MGKKSESASKKTAPERDDQNAVVISGIVKRPNQTEKVCRFTLDVATPTPKGNTAHAYVPCVWFNGDTDETVEEGEHISVNGALKSGVYEKKDGTKVYTLDVVVDHVIFE